MRLIPTVAAALVLSISAPAFAQEWVEFASRQDRFTCNFPSQPTITQMTYISEFGADLPARVYSSAQGQSRYSVTVVDYNQSQRILTEKAKACPPGIERCVGGLATGEGYWKQDVLGAKLYATFKFLQRDTKLTHLGYNTMDRVEGQQVQLTNPDKSRTLVGIYMHENKLYIIEGTVPAGYPEPALFQQSLGWLDGNGVALRYQSVYINGVPAPPRENRPAVVVGEGPNQIDAPDANTGQGR